MQDYQKYLEQVKTELRLRNYSPKTIKSYLLCIEYFFRFLGSNFERMQIDKIRQFLLQKQEKGSSGQTLNLYLNSIKFFYREIMKSGQKIDLKFAKTSKKIPIVLSKSEIAKILLAIKNKKHRLIIALAYGAGLRVSEIISLKVKDIDLEGLTIHIKQAKGYRDRLTIFSEKLRKPLQIILELKNPNELIFESNRDGKLSERTLQKIFTNALKNAKIKKEATFHSLRHSFATHLLENGTDIRYIQELLGHTNIRTTQIYTKVTNPNIRNIKSPL